MATVYLTTTHPHSMGTCEKLRELVAQDRYGVHELADDPEGADLILFVESLDTWPSMLHARRDPLVRRFREKTFAYCEMDLAIPFLPGVYPSVPKRFYSRSRHRTSCYVAMFANPYVAPGPLPERPYLFSFVGHSKTARLRERVLALSHPEAYVDDSAPRHDHAYWGDDPAARESYQSDYARLLRDSLFVLCPRGLSPATVRVFEVMQSGRVPVVMSDQWVAPDGPDWDSFSIRVREADVEGVPALLESRRDDAVEMGARAREAWEEWFAPDVIFHRIVEYCLSIARSRQRPESLLRHGVWRQVIASPYRRVFARDLVLERRARRSRPAAVTA